MLDESRVTQTPWHARDASAAISELDTDETRGLDREEAAERLERFGLNTIRTAETDPWWKILIDQFADPLIYILIAAGGVTLAVQDYIDSAVIFAAVGINAAIGFVQESRARKAIHALSEMSAPKADVIRDGGQHEIDTRDLVPGDVVTLRSGGRVPADLRLIRADDLRIDESALTGESQAVTKQAEPVTDENAVPGDRLSMAFAGTNVSRGRGRGIVVGTGDASELGRIAETAQQMEEVRTPVQRKMDFLGKVIGVAIGMIALLIVGVGIFKGMSSYEIATTAAAMAVGAVPEALPVVLTIALAVGVQRMAQRNAIIRSLPAVETLGSTTVIGSDKTGTLTSNQMTVRAIRTAHSRYEVTGSGYSTSGDIQPASSSSPEHTPQDDHALRQTLLAGVLANETSRLPGEDEVATGDPTELAVLVSAVKGGVELEATRADHTQVHLIPFESERKFMATLNDTPHGRRVFIKGAPEAVLQRCAAQLTPAGEEQDLDADALRELAHELADQGYRVLGTAYRDTESDQDHIEEDDLAQGLIFAGFQGMEDPVRPEAIEAVKATRHAGIRVIMLTGDHADTAQAIGRQLGIDEHGAGARAGRELDDLSDDELRQVVGDVNVFARVSPDHKHKLVEQLKAMGHVVAVTGDGVNDAPALQAAHLGVAMGQTGTDVAREAADMVLADDNFASITRAVEQGRLIFANIRKVTYFLLATGMGLVITILFTLFADWPLPYLAAQVLWINLVTNGLQDVALAFEKDEPGLLEQPPRDPREGVINREMLYRLVGISTVIGACTLGVFWYMLRQDVPMELARSVAMTQMVLFQFFHVINARSLRRSVFQVPLKANPFLAFSIAAAFLAHLGALHLPFMQAIFDTTPLSLAHWAMVIAVGAIVVAVSEVDKIYLRRKDRQKMGG